MAANVGPRLKALREFYGFSQRELAKRAGVPNSAISVIEQGSVSPSVLSLEKVLKGFPIALKHFFSIDVEASCAEPDVGSNLPCGGIVFQLPSASSSGVLQFQRGASSQLPEITVPDVAVLLVVLEGAVGVDGLQGTYTLGSGETLRLDAGSPYRLQVSTEEARWLLLDAPT